MEPEFNTAVYAARENKSARWASYFAKHGVTSDMVSRMGLHAPEWALLAKAITVESGRKLIAPGSQETVDCIVRNLRYQENQERAADVPFDFRAEVK